MERWRLLVYRIGVVGGIAAGTRKVVCPGCRRPAYQVGVALPRCSYCGDPFDGPTRVTTPPTGKE